MITNERETRTARLIAVANEMMTAARTAPKAKGQDSIEVLLLTGESIQMLSDAMHKYSVEMNLGFISRDAENILKAEAIVLIGTKEQQQNINCGYCGFETCADKLEKPKVPCAIKIVDVGIAIGSAVSVAADKRVDSRVMFSIGRVAKELNLLPECTSMYGIPISCSSKNPFFDR